MKFPFYIHMHALLHIKIHCIIKINKSWEYWNKAMPVFRSTIPLMCFSCRLSYLSKGCRKSGVLQKSNLLCEKYNFLPEIKDF